MQIILNVVIDTDNNEKSLQIKVGDNAITLPIEVARKLPKEIEKAITPTELDNESNLPLQNVSHCDNDDEDEEDVILEDECPNCGSDSVGFNGDNNECFRCGSEWSY